MATSWIQRGNFKGDTGDTGPTGPDGADGTSITGATVNGSGDLIIDLSTGGSVNAGHVVGVNGTSVNFENSVANVAALPDTPALLSAYYVVADGHLYVYEGADAADDGKEGYTDVGAIKGDTGDTGPSGADGSDGTDGVSVVGAAVNGSGHLILTLSVGGPIDAGVAKGADGATGATGSAGADGTKIFAYSTTPPTISTVPVGSLAIGANGDFLEAT